MDTGKVEINLLFGNFLSSDFLRPSDVSMMMTGFTEAPEEYGAFIPLKGGTKHNCS